VWPGRIVRVAPPSTPQNAVPTPRYPSPETRNPPARHFSPPDRWGSPVVTPEFASRAPVASLVRPPTSCRRRRRRTRGPVWPTARPPGHTVQTVSRRLKCILIYHYYNYILHYIRRSTYYTPRARLPFGKYLTTAADPFAYTFGSFLTQ